MADKLASGDMPLSIKEKEQLGELMLNGGEVKKLFARLVDSVASGDMPMMEGPTTLRMEPCQMPEDGQLGILFSVHIPRLETKMPIPARVLLRALGDPGTEKAIAVDLLCSEVQGLAEGTVSEMANTLAHSRGVGRKVRDEVKKRRKEGGDAHLLLALDGTDKDCSYESVFVDRFCEARDTEDPKEAA